MILMLGGFQGLGKTTIITIIDETKRDLGLVVISGDEVRQGLFDKKCPFSKGKGFGQKAILHRGYFMALDTNATPTKIEQA